MVVFANNDELLHCGDSVEEELYWYRNAELLQSAGVTHRLIGGSTDLEGVYQCFTLTSDGTWYQHTWRVFDHREFVIYRRKTKCMCIYVVVQFGI